MTQWREILDVHAPRYIDEPFTFGAVAEVDVAERSSPARRRTADATEGPPWGGGR
ncbi:MAG TPA: hypothetical protein VLA35_12060 [Thermoleophilia bacterium]|nr:hypothetical protein [Thermoleophilia bacterium]